MVGCKAEVIHRKSWKNGAEVELAKSISQWDTGLTVDDCWRAFSHTRVSADTDKVNYTDGHRKNDLAA
uniref:hypothetical protein n=1 Tax=Escherichia coli TaxID=562 RepID=UPI00339512F9